MALNHNTARAALGTALAGITGLRVYDHTASGGAVPAAMVLLPAIIYDNTMKRGTDRDTFTVLVIVGKVSDRAAATKVLDYASGTGGPTDSVKAALDAVVGVRVESADPTDVTWGGVPYLAYEFTVTYVA